MKQESKFRANQEQNLDQQQATSSTPTEFPSVEAMLKHDRLHTPIPPNIQFRLQKSLEGLPRADQPWWRRLFKGQ